VALINAVEKKEEEKQQEKPEEQRHVSTPRCSSVLPACRWMAEAMAEERAEGAVADQATAEKRRELNRRDGALRSSR